MCPIGRVVFTGDTEVEGQSFYLDDGAMSSHHLVMRDEEFPRATHQTQ